MRAKKTQTGTTKQPKDYFKVVYKADKSGEFKQSRFDKMRDGIFVKLFNKYSKKSLSKSSIIDIGCGYGYLMDSFSAAKEVYGTDISPEAVAIAQKRNEKYKVSQMDILKPLKLKHNFDLVLAINVIEHLSKPKVGIKNSNKLLYKDGLAIIHLPTINNKFSGWLYNKTYAKDPTHVYMPKGDEVKKLFTDEGFELLQESYMPYWPKFIFKHAKLHPAYMAVFRLSDTTKSVK